MRASKYIIRPVGLLFLVLLTVQLTGLTCIGERPSVAADTLTAVEADHQQHDGYLQTGGDGPLSQAGHLDDGGDFDDCPCHLGFARPLPATVTTFLRLIAPVSVPAHPPVARISTVIFQPPKISA